MLGTTRQRGRSENQFRVRRRFQSWCLLALWLWAHYLSSMNPSLSPCFVNNKGKNNDSNALWGFFVKVSYVRVASMVTVVQEVLGIICLEHLGSPRPPPCCGSVNTGPLVGWLNKAAYSVVNPLPRPHSLLQVPRFEFRVLHNMERTQRSQRLPSFFFFLQMSKLVSKLSNGLDLSQLVNENS